MDLSAELPKWSLGGDLLQARELREQVSEIRPIRRIRGLGRSCLQVAGGWTVLD